MRRFALYGVCCAVMMFALCGCRMLEWRQVTFYKGLKIREDLLEKNSYNLKYKYGNRNFWCRGYFVDTVGKNAKMIQEYIRNQLEEDLARDQISLKEYMDPFTGSKRK